MEFDFLSELYEHDTPRARLLAEYPSSNSNETHFRNRSKYIIHDPFPPPRRELLKVLGPHHLMCAWGRHLSVSSEVPPPRLLLDHWETVFGKEGCPDWQPFDPEADYITLFPHESLASAHQVVDPDVNYAVHSKEVIEKIDCPQAEVLDSVVPPCIVKLSHGYAGLGNFLIRNETDEADMRQQLALHWPDATVVTNSIIENITGDFGVQFYLRRDGTMLWLGLTEQHFDGHQRWCGGMFSADLQMELHSELCGMIEPVGMHLHRSGYFGLVGIDILRDTANQLFLIDVNPRLTGISPFLVASRLFAREGLTEGIYQASQRFCGSCEQLISTAEQTPDARVVIFSAVEEVTHGGDTATICHLSVSSDAQERNQQILQQILPN
jgi:hypothetical protein